MESGLSSMLAEIVAMEERKQALLEELNELDQRLFKAKSKWVRAHVTAGWTGRQGMCGCMMQACPFGTACVVTMPVTARALSNRGLTDRTKRNPRQHRDRDLVDALLLML